MTKNDVLLLLTHGALSGLCSRPPIASIDEIGKDSVKAARAALGSLESQGFIFDGQEDTADAPSVTPITTIGEYDPAGATDATAAFGIAKMIQGSDKNLKELGTQTVRDFQHAAGLKVDGSPGPKTLAAYMYWSSQ